MDAYQKAEGSVRELAVRFKVTPGTVQNYLNLKRKTGSVAPRPHGGGPQPKLDEGGVQQVRTVVGLILADHLRPGVVGVRGHRGCEGHREQDGKGDSRQRR